MPFIEVFLPTALHDEVTRRNLQPSELLQIAVSAEIVRQESVAALDTYIEDLSAVVGEPSEGESARARAISRAVLDAQLDRAG